MAQLELCSSSETSSYLCLLPAEAAETLAAEMSFGDPCLALALRVERSCFYFHLLHDRYHLFAFGCSSRWSLLERGWTWLRYRTVPKASASSSRGRSMGCASPRAEVKLVRARTVSWVVLGGLRWRRSSAAGGDRSGLGPGQCQAAVPGANALPCNMQNAHRSNGNFCLTSAGAIN